jgi:hypothetical protein
MKTMSQVVSNILFQAYKSAQPPERDMIIDLLEAALLAAEEGETPRAKELLHHAMNVAEGKTIVGFIAPS